MIRRWVVRPDPQTGFVDGGEMQQSMLEASVMLTRMGGYLAVSQDRAATGIPGEMLPVSVMFEWKDRTDAKPQPEQTSNFIGEIGEMYEEAAAPEPEQAEEAAAAEVVSPGDPFIERDENGEPTVDWTGLADAPASAR